MIGEATALRIELDKRDETITDLRMENARLTGHIEAYRAEMDRLRAQIETLLKWARRLP